MSDRLNLKYIDTSICYEDEDIIEIRFYMNRRDYLIEISSKNNHIQLFLMNDDDRNRLTSLYINKKDYEKFDFKNENEALLREKHQISSEEVEKALEIIKSVAYFNKEY